MSGLSLERQLTFEPVNHILTNIAVWSPDSRKIVYDVRSDAEGSCFDGTRIETVSVDDGRVETVYTSKNGACCGVVTCSPQEEAYIFILGPEFPTDDWSYALTHRQGILVKDGNAVNIDARDIVPPFTPGALRGGSHVHVFSGDGKWISFTYNDHVLNLRNDSEGGDLDQRNIGISIPLSRPVVVGKDHLRNHDSEFFSVLVTETVNAPEPGSDEINRAYEDGWVGTEGYLRPDGSRQHRAIAFLGDTIAKDGKTLTEVFIVDIPDHLEKTLEYYPADDLADDPWFLAGTETKRPQPPLGVVQRRLTFTEGHRYPGVFGPRHWVRCSPDGSKIAFLMRDDNGIVQIWVVSPNGGEPIQVTRGSSDVASTFSWSPDGKFIAYMSENRICLADSETGQTRFLTSPSDEPILSLAVVFSPDGQKIAYLRNILHENGCRYNQIFICDAAGAMID